MKKLISLLFLLSSDLWACPACSGGKTDNGYTTIIVLGIFILSTYVPLYMIFKLIFKNKSINKRPL